MWANRYKNNENWNQLISVWTIRTTRRETVYKHCSTSSFIKEERLPPAHHHIQHAWRWQNTYRRSIFRHSIKSLSNSHTRNPTLHLMNYHMNHRRCSQQNSTVSTFSVQLCTFRHCACNIWHLFDKPGMWMFFTTNLWDNQGKSCAYMGAFLFIEFPPYILCK